MASVIFVASCAAFFFFSAQHRLTATLFAEEQSVLWRVQELMFQYRYSEAVAQLEDFFARRPATRSFDLYFKYLSLKQHHQHHKTTCETEAWSKLRKLALTGEQIALLRIGDHYSNDHRQNIEHVLKESLEMYPHYVPILMEQFYFYKNSDSRKAIEACDAILKNVSSSKYDRSWAYIAKGSVLLNGNTSSSLLNGNTSNSSLLNGNTNSNSLLNGNTSNNVDEAIKCFDEALNLVPLAVDALCSRATANWKKKEKERTLHDVETVLRMYPTLGRARLLKASYLKHMRGEDAALHECKRFLEEAQFDEKMFKFAKNLLAGQVDKLAQLYDFVIKIYRRTQLGELLKREKTIILAMAGKFDAAVAYAREALPLEPAIIKFLRCTKNGFLRFQQLEQIRTTTTAKTGDSPSKSSLLTGEMLASLRPANDEEFKQIVCCLCFLEHFDAEQETAMYRTAIQLYDQLRKPVLRAEKELAMANSNELIKFVRNPDQLEEMARNTWQI